MANNILPDNLREIIQNTGVNSLPSNPSAKGYSANEIKAAFIRASMVLADNLIKLDQGNQFKNVTVKMLDELPDDLSAYEDGTILFVSDGTDISVYIVNDGESTKIGDSLKNVFDALDAEGEVNAPKDGEGNVITETYETKEDANSKFALVPKLAYENIFQEKNTFSKIVTFAEKANFARYKNVCLYEGHLEIYGSDVFVAFGTGNDLVQYKVPFIGSSHYGQTYTLATKDQLDGAVSRSNLVSVLGEASSLLNGLMSSTDKSRLDALYALLGAEADQDAVVNTINEVLALFEQYPEGATIVNALSAKLSKAEAAETYFSKQDGFAIGLISFSEYDEDTGEISIMYNSSAISDISYDDDTGMLTFTY